MLQFHVFSAQAVAWTSIECRPIAIAQSAQTGTPTLGMSKTRSTTTSTTTSSSSYVELGGSYVIDGQLCGSSGSSSSSSSFGGPRYVPGQMLLRMHSGVSISQIQGLSQINQTYGVQSVTPLYGGSFADPAAAAQYGLDRAILVVASPWANLDSMQQDYLNSGNGTLIQRAAKDLIGEVGPATVSGGSTAGAASTCGTQDDLQSCTARRDQGAPLYCPEPNEDAQFVLQANLHSYGQNGASPDYDIDASEAWYLHRGNEQGIGGIKVAVIDTGVKGSHPDLQGRVLPGWNYMKGLDVSSPCNNVTVGTCDDFGHGTSVAGIIVANGGNGIGVAGIHFGAQVVPLKACNDNGDCNLSKVVSAIGEAADGKMNGQTVVFPPVQIINLSLEFENLDANDPNPLRLQDLHDAVEYAKSRGVLIVASSGNDKTNNGIDEPVAYPANYEEVIAVGASNQCNGRVISPYPSNYGPQVDLSAPGENVRTTDRNFNNPYSNFGLTSAAAPHVSGVAALVMSYRPCLSSDDVREVLTLSAVDRGPDGRDDEFGFGEVNAHRALVTATVSCGFVESPIIPLTLSSAESFASIEGLGINDAGDVVGAIYNTEQQTDELGGQNGFIFQSSGGGTLVQRFLGTAELRSINDNNQMVGGSSLFTFDGSNWIESSLPHGGGFSLNDMGTIVGAHEEESTPEHPTDISAFQYQSSNGIFTVLDPIIEGFYGNSDRLIRIHQALDINDNGLVTGVTDVGSSSFGGGMRGFVLDPVSQAISDLPMPPDTPFDPTSYGRMVWSVSELNESGEMYVVGSGTRVEACDPLHPSNFECCFDPPAEHCWDHQPVLWEGTLGTGFTPRKLPKPAGFNAYAASRDVNQHGIAIGYAETSAGSSAAVLWQSTPVENCTGMGSSCSCDASGSNCTTWVVAEMNEVLQQVAPAEASAWDLLSANALNDNNQLTGTAIYNDDPRPVGYRLSLPVAP